MCNSATYLILRCTLGYTQDKKNLATSVTSWHLVLKRTYNFLGLSVFINVMRCKPFYLEQWPTYNISQCATIKCRNLNIFHLESPLHCWIGSHRQSTYMRLWDLLASSWGPFVNSVHETNYHTRCSDIWIFFKQFHPSQGTNSTCIHNKHYLNITWKATRPPNTVWAWDSWHICSSTMDDSPTRSPADSFQLLSTKLIQNLLC